MLSLTITNVGENRSIVEVETVTNYTLDSNFAKSSTDENVPVL